MCVYMLACIYIYIYIHMYACIYVCMYICMLVAVNLPCACPDSKPYCILFICKGSELNNFNIAYILLILQLFC